MPRIHASNATYAARSLRQLFGQRQGWLAAFVLGVLCLGYSSAIRALDPSTPLTGYARQTWVMENGLPQNTVTALLQTQDGFLWIGTEAGLVRFDGNSFQVFDRNSEADHGSGADHRPDASMPGNDICCLLEGPDGALWVGTSEGLARWEQGAFRSYTTRDGLPGNSIRALARTTDAQLWAYTDQGPARLNGDRFVATAWNAANMAATAATSGGGAFWTDSAPVAGAVANLWKRIEEQAGLQRDSVEFETALGPDQRVFANRSVLVVIHGDRIVTQLRAGKELPGSRIQALLADRQGSLWVGMNSGLARLSAGKLQVLPVADSLGNESVLALLQDREGNLWVGTESGGLHILRDQRFRTIGTREGLSSDVTTALVEDRAGTLWVGTQGAGLNAIPGGISGSKVLTFTLQNGLMSDVILSLAAAPNGDVWVGTPDGLNRIRGNRVDAFTSADGLPDDFIRSLLVDADESLWIGTRRGLVHWSNAGGNGPDLRPQSGMQILTQANGLGSNTVGALARDAGGDLWVATFAGLSRLHNGQITNFTTANGLSSNVLTALLPRSDGTMLIGTQDHGLNNWDGAKFTPITGAGLEQITIHAILDDHNGHLWIATDNGIARCDCTVDAGKGLSGWIAFGTADGLRSRETAANSHPSAVRSKDGRLWFATPRGVVEVDAARFPVNTVVPPVVVERFAVDDVEQPLVEGDSGPRVAAGHVHFQFDYAGLSFTAPLKVRYRYRLEGFDKDWTDAGTRRTAYYTNIPPGQYTFRVQAANNDGLWNTTGASFPFELRPHFYQTMWFYMLLLAAAAAGIFLLLRRRLRLAEREFQAVLGERSRIAREIHDTLAQGYVGISIQLEMLSELLRQHKIDAAANQLDVTRGYVCEGLADARQSIWALRTQDSGETTLPVRIGRLAEAAGGNGLNSQFNVFGAYRPLAAEKEREVLRIAQEAIHNVKKHSGARELSVHLRYSPATVELEVCDDGKGGAQDGKASTLQGGFGMTGMRERAANIGGTLDVTSVEGEGTTVRLRVPAPGEMREHPGELK
jgi:ligand-binding sensor domain-containing protein/signal transduction histidine kinase